MGLLRSKMKINVLSISFLIVFTAMTFFSGCGGSSGSDVTNTLYSGATSAATVLGENPVVTSEVVAGFEDEGELNLVIHSAIAGLPPELINSLGDFLSKGDGPTFPASLYSLPSATGDAKITATTIEISEVINGESGSVAIEGSVSLLSLSGVITFNFDNFLYETGIPAFNGIITMNVSANQPSTDPDTVITAKLDCASLTMTDGDEITTFAGSMTISISLGGECFYVSSSLSYMVNDESGVTYWDETLWTYDNEANTCTVTGKIYNSERGGFLTVSGTLTCTSNESTGLLNPAGGDLYFTGIDNSQVKLTFTGSSFSLEIDADGDGIFEYPAP
jgi:hypothetical protein